MRRHNKIHTYGNDDETPIYMSVVCIKKLSTCNPCVTIFRQGPEGILLLCILHKLYKINLTQFKLFCFLVKAVQGAEMPQKCIKDIFYCLNTHFASKKVGSKHTYFL